MQYILVSLAAQSKHSSLKLNPQRLKPQNLVTHTNITSDSPKQPGINNTSDDNLRYAEPLAPDCKSYYKYAGEHVDK